MRFLVILLGLVMLAACERSAIRPDPILAAQPTPLQVARDGAVADAGKLLSWGGRVQAVHNRARDTRIEILAYPLDGQRRPLAGLPGNGRFQVEMDGFLEPRELPPGTLVTVRGRFVRLLDGQVGEAPYRFPLLLGEQLDVWPVRRDADAGRPSVRWSIGVGSAGSGVGVGIGF